MPSLPEMYTLVKHLSKEVSILPKRYHNTQILNIKKILSLWESSVLHYYYFCYYFYYYYYCCESTFISDKRLQG